MGDGVRGGGTAVIGNVCIGFVMFIKICIRLLSLSMHVLGVYSTHGNGDVAAKEHQSFFGVCLFFSVNE